MRTKCNRRIRSGRKQHEQRRRRSSMAPVLTLASQIALIFLTVLPSTVVVAAATNSTIAMTTDTSETAKPTATVSRKQKEQFKVRSSVADQSGNDAKEIISTSTSVDIDNMSLSQILAKAGKKGLGGGIPGFIAGIVQVLTLMWVRTVMNYQQRYGTTFKQTLKLLFNEGGIPRFYRGLSFALVQAPMARFVATAANDGCIALLASLEYTKHWGPARGTFISSAIVGLWRMLLMPIDTCKTVLQVDSAEGFQNLMRKVKAGKIGLLYQGCFALVASSFVGHYPWFYTFRLLSESVLIQNMLPAGLIRNAFIGFSASVVSDVVSNGIRVVKTTKQSIGGSRHAVSYGEAISIIVSEDGWRGLLGRGLKTRIFGNALQSVLFTIVWRGLAEHWSSESKDSTPAKVTEEPGQLSLEDKNRGETS